MRLIDAERLKAVLEKNFGHTGGASVLEQLIDEQPTIQPEQCGDKSYTLWKESYEELKRRMDELTSCSDIISRQQAIDGKILIQRTNGVEIYSDEAVPVEYLKRLPAIQPVATDTNVGDTISRQAAIDAVNNAFDGETLLTGFVRSIAVRAIRDMPSVQPEPKEGHWIEGGIYRDVIECNCSECGQLITTAATVRMNYCPNCGAKMINK